MDTLDILEHVCLEEETEPLYIPCRKCERLVLRDIVALYIPLENDLCNLKCHDCKMDDGEITMQEHEFLLEKESQGYE